MKKEISEIRYPNTVNGNEQNIYNSRHYKIEKIKKKGEMFKIGWFRISSNGIVLAEIKESICDIYFKSIN